MAVESQQQSTAAPNAAPAASAPLAGAGAPQRVVDSMSTRVDVINTHAGRILCVADVRGQFSSSPPCFCPRVCRSEGAERRTGTSSFVVVRSSALLHPRIERGLQSRWIGPRAYHVSNRRTRPNAVTPCEWGRAAV